MVALGELQLHIRNAVVSSNFSFAPSLLAGGRDSVKRLAIHRRHYETSLVTALIEKFPATVWLAGSSLVTEAARSFVGCQPPQAPCIAEYGENFPQFLSRWAGSSRLEYLREFAELEWHVGHAAVSVEEPALTAEAFLGIDADVLERLRLRLQSGARYLQASWPVDELLTIYLTRTAPESLELQPMDLGLEVYGTRSEFRVSRLDAGTCAFRKAISEGQSLGDAAVCGMESQPGFDPGRAFVELVSTNLVTAIEEPLKSKEKVHEY